MIKKLTKSDLDQVAHIHKSELSGFLTELGHPFLKKFYETSLSEPSLFTFVYKEADVVLGFVTGVESTLGLYKKLILKDIVGYGLIFTKFVLTHPVKSIKILKTHSYPGFSQSLPELLTIAVSKRFQKKGIGTRLFVETANEFKKRGIREFKISVYDRLPANGFYKKTGCRFDRSFEFLGEKMNYFTYKILSSKS